jgi:hypothetical protein
MKYKGGLETWLQVATRYGRLLCDHPGFDKEDLDSADIDKKGNVSKDERLKSGGSDSTKNGSGSDLKRNKSKGGRGFNKKGNQSDDERSESKEASAKKVGEHQLRTWGMSEEFWRHNV